MKLRYSEAFYSIQGEGRFVGVPSIFLRVFGCNLTCSAFGQSRNEDERVSVENMPYITDPRADRKHPEAYTSIEELPVTALGCDSSASWAVKYKHLQLTKTVEEVADHIKSLLPNGTFKSDSGEDIHLVITGGEPLLGWQRVWPELFSYFGSEEMGLKNITFETNGTQLVSDDFARYLNKVCEAHITWSTSPKLSISGEDEIDALIPESLLSMNQVEGSYLYNKFVVRDEQCFSEVDHFVKEYREAGVKLDSVYCMPEGATLEQLTYTEKDVADICLKTGYKFSPRLHCHLFGNGWGT